MTFIPLILSACILACAEGDPGSSFETQNKLLVLADRITANAAPSWPEQYEVEYEINLPYINVLQENGLTNHFKAWQDKTNGRQKTTKDGVESVVEFIANNSMYQIFPRIDKMACRHLEIAGGAGPTRKLLANAKPKLGLILPDLTESRWKKNSTAKIESGRHKGKDADAYSWVHTKNMGYGGSTAAYTMFVSQDGSPLRLDMWGVNLFTGGHYDAYIVDYYNYKPTSIENDVFSVPDTCPHKLSAENSLMARKTHWLTKLRATLPNPHFGWVQAMKCTMHLCINLVAATPVMRSI